MVLTGAHKWRYAPHLRIFFSLKSNIRPMQIRREIERYWYFGI